MKQCVAQMKTIKIEGTEYEVIRAKPFLVEGKSRTELFMKRPKGKVRYAATVYENGAISSVISLWSFA